MKNFGIDWSATKCAVVEDGQIAIHRKGTLSAVLTDILIPSAPCRVAIESTFESYDVEAHNKFLELCEQYGIDVFLVQPRETKNFRLDHDIPKSDNNDAIAIYRIAFEEGRVRDPKPWVTDDAPSLSKRMMAMRRSKYKNLDGKRVTALLKIAGIERTALNRQAALVALDVIDQGGNRKDFDRAMGTYSHGYPSQQRASFMRDRVWTLVGRQVGLHPATARKNAHLYKQQRKEALIELRRETRRIFHTVKNMSEGTRQPEKGTSEPRSLVTV